MLVAVGFLFFPLHFIIIVNIIIMTVIIIIILFVDLSIFIANKLFLTTVNKIFS